MPTCQNKQCNKSFPKHPVVDGKKLNLQNRKYCFECSPLRKHNTKQLEKEVPFVPEEGIETKCNSCPRVYFYKKQTGHTKTKCNSCMVNVRRFAFKDKAIEYKGGKCILCGYNKSTRALVFHHVDEDLKSLSIAGNHARAWKVMEKELDKCVLLCSNCHMEVHDGLATLPS